MFAWDTAEEERSGWTATAAIVAALAFLAWLGSYASGALPWLGYAWLKREWQSSGPLLPSGETSMGTELGLTSFLFFEGQEIVVDWNAEIRAGSLWFYVYNPYDGRLGDGVAHYVTESGAGTWTTRIPKTGMYTITIEPTTVRSDDRGWDLGYSVWWGARPAG
jgi:hypothetical protein